MKNLLLLSLWHVSSFHADVGVGIEEKMGM
jgi:hypothetical protein